MNRVFKPELTDSEIGAAVQALIGNLLELLSAPPSASPQDRIAILEQLSEKLAAIWQRNDDLYLSDSGSTYMLAQLALEMADASLKSLRSSAKAEKSCSDARKTESTLLEMLISGLLLAAEDAQIDLAHWLLSGDHMVAVVTGDKCSAHEFSLRVPKISACMPSSKQPPQEPWNRHGKGRRRFPVPQNDRGRPQV